MRKTSRAVTRDDCAIGALVATLVLLWIAVITDNIALYLVVSGIQLIITLSMMTVSIVRFKRSEKTLSHSRTKFTKEK